MTNVRRHVPVERKPGEKSSLTPQTTIFNATKSPGPKPEKNYKNSQTSIMASFCFLY